MTTIGRAGDKYVAILDGHLFTLKQNQNTFARLFLNLDGACGLNIIKKLNMMTIDGQKTDCNFFMFTNRKFSDD